MIGKDGSQYSSAYPPLPYLFGKLVLRIHPTLETLRVLNLVVFLVSLGLFYLIAGKVSRSPGLLTSLYALNPYLLKASFAYLMYNWGLAFALAGIYIYFFKPRPFQPMAHFFLGAAVLSQQWLLAVVAAILVSEFLEFRQGKKNAAELAWLLLQKILFLSPAAILFFRWHGLVHPNFASHSLQPTIEHLNAVLANLGLALFFIVAFHLKKLVIRRNVALIFLLPLLWLAIPVHSSGHGPRVVTGIASQLSVKLADLVGAPYKLTMLFLILCGLAALCLLLSREEEGLRGVMKYALLALLMAFMASSRLAASHIYASLPFAWLAFSDEVDGMGQIKFALVAQFFAMSSLYMVYIVFFRSHGIMF